MSETSLSSLVGVLRDTGLLTSSQLATLAELELQQAEPRAAADLLRERQWLTPYQIEQLSSEQPRENLVVGPYHLLDRLGEGGMGQVFKARHHLLQRVVALKLVLAERLVREPEAVQRFEREARAAALLSHPHIVVIYDAGSAGQAYYIAMEYLDGVDLGRLVRDGGPLPIAKACDYVRQAALGLQHAHEHGMVHRDIKPSNLLLTSAGQVKILDLGLARFDQGADPTASLTREGTIVGTPDFIAPEQARNARKVDIRADLYSLGATFYFLLTGRAPFLDGTPIEKLLKHQLDEPTPVHKLRSAVPRSMSAIIHQLLAKAPQDRFQTPADLATALGAWTGRATPPEPTDLSAIQPAPSRLVPDSNPGVTLTATTPDLGTGDSDTTEVAQQAKHLARLTGHIGGVLALCFNADRDTLASGGMDGTVRLWDFSHGAKPRAVLRKHAGAVSALAFDIDDRLLAAGSGSSDGLIWLGDPTQPDPPDLAMLRGHTAAIVALAFSPTDHLLASASQDSTIRIWELDSRPRVRQVLQGHTGPIRALAFAPDGQWLASAGMDDSVRLWDIGRKRPQSIATLPHQGGAHTVAFAADGDLLAAGGADGILRLWDLSHDQQVQFDSELHDHEGPIRLVQIAPDGERLVAVGEGRHLTVWFQESEQTQRWLLPMMNHPCFGLTQDSRYLAHGGVDGVVNVYRVGEKRPRPS